ncbi:MAG: chromosomal replication initiator protein DnaA [Phycisphaerae bacterium]|nr:chromosomal replication initiator protein DnaA [Phycisphaerae bacterium]
METNCVELLDNITDSIADKVGQNCYKMWFKNTTKMIIEDNYLKIGVPNQFTGNWIEKKYLSQINEAINEVSVRHMDITFVVDPELSGKQRSRQLDNQAASVSQTINPTGKRVRRQEKNPVKLRMKLEEFVVGTSNQLAFNAAKMVVAQPGSHFNPLFIHGGCGLGKTHLLQGICNATIANNPQTRVLYVSGEEFTNRFVMALKSGKLDLFRHRFRQVDLLVIDDVHFLASKKATQEEFLHTFNAIDAANKQVVLASDAHPKMIGQLSESLINRFISGMVVKIDAPDLLTRCGILRQRAAKMEKHVPDVVIEYIADNVRANVRELEGALLKVLAFTQLMRVPIDLNVANQALADHIVKSGPVVHVSDIETITATFFGITPADLHSSRKTRTISLARSLSMYLARKHTSMSYPEIGRFMGNKNHATAILACKKVKAMLANADEPVSWQSSTGKRQMGIIELLEKLEASFTNKR